MKDSTNIDFLERFTLYLKLERGLSQNTALSYRSDISLLGRFLEREGEGQERAPLSFAECSLEQLELFLKYLYERGSSKRTQARVISSLRSLFNFLLIEGEIEESSALLLEIPKINPNLPSLLSIEEVLKVIEGIDLSTPLGHRNRAIFEILYSCGLRASELVSLQLSDLFFEEGFIRVVGKGNKQRLIPIGEHAIAAVELYMGQRRAMKVKRGSEDILFLNRRGGKLSREMLFILVKGECEAAGIKKRVSPHTFRHTFATHLLENGADLRAIQEMLGHESILTTEIYTHVDSKKWQETILSHHPREGSKKRG
ncbi:MAG: site-specific tyrosine recombinase/integron integrase [Bacteroidales bacterium]